MRNPLHGSIVMTLFLPACNLSFSSAAMPGEEEPLTTLGLPLTSMLQPLVPDEPTKTDIHPGRSNRSRHPASLSLSPVRVIESCNTMIKG